MAFIEFGVADAGPAAVAAAPAAPAPVVPPVPVAPPAAPRRLTVTVTLPTWGNLLTVLNVLALAGLVAYFGWRWFSGGGGITPLPQPDAAAASGVKLGRAFVPSLAGALADGFEALGAGVAAKKPVGDSDNDLRTAFESSRQKAFAATSAPAFAALVPEGAEPADDATRARYVQLCKDFAAGLRQAK